MAWKKRKRAAGQNQPPRKRASLRTAEGGRFSPPLEDTFNFNNNNNDDDNDEDEEYVDDYYEQQEQRQQHQQQHKSNGKSISTSSHTSGPLDVGTGQRSAFPVQPNLGSINLDNPPLNASDYLRRVSKEANDRPSIVHVKRPQLQSQPQPPRIVQFGGRTLKSYSDDPIPASIALSQTPTVTATTPAAPTTPATSLTINLDWHKSFQATFSATKSPFNSISNHHHLPLPARYADPNSLPQAFSKWRQFFLDPQNPPIISLLASFPHALLIKLIGYCHKWVSGNMSPLLARWIFALLARLPDTLTGDEIAVLRDLAKKCVLVRNNPLQSLAQTTTICLDMTVSVVAGYYGQKDLITNL